MRKSTLFLLTISSIGNIFAQAPPIDWQNTIGGNGYEDFRSLQQTSDGGYILAGFSGSGISGDRTENSQGGNDYWIVKLNSQGTIQWQNALGGNDNDHLTFIRQTSDNGYILGGHSFSGNSGDKTETSNGILDYWIVKLDSLGVIQWQNAIGGSDYEAVYSIEQTTDGGYIIAGFSLSGISGDKTEANNGGYDYWIVKLNSTGGIQWQNTIGGNQHDYAFSVHQCPDGGYFVAGESFSGISGDRTEASQGSNDFWVMKLNSNGAIVWQNAIGGSGSEFLYSTDLTSDGGYILGGYSSSGISGDRTESSQGGYDYWVVKLDSLGTIQWQNAIGGSNDDNLNFIEQTVDNGYILGGYSNSNTSGDKTENSYGGIDYWLVKINSLGAIEWQDDFGGTLEDRSFTVRQTLDGGYVLGARSYSNASGNKAENSNGDSDYWIIKLLCAEATLNLPDTAFCSNAGTVFLSGGSPPGGTYVGPGVSNNIFDPVAAGIGSHQIMYIYTSGCGTDTAVQMINVSNVLGPIVALGLDVEQCGGQVILNAGNPGSAYLWSTSQTSQGITVNSSGTYYVTVNDSNDCSQKDTINVLIHPLPVAPFGADIEQCGGPVILNAGNPGSDYLWSTTQTSQSISVNLSGTYSVTVNDINNCSKSDTVNVLIHPLPVVPFGSDIEQCAGTVVLNAGNPGSTYLWSTTQTLQSINVNSSGAYFVTVTDSNNCSRKDTINVLIHPLPVIPFGADIEQCGGSVILDAGNPGSDYVWSTTQTSQNVTVNSSGTYSVTVSDVNNCIQSDTINVLIYSLPVVSLGPDVEQCGGSVILDAGNPGSVYLWSTTQISQGITISLSGIYSVKITDGNNCSNSDTVNVLINPLPFVFLGLDIQQCAGTVTLNAGNPSAMYLWSTTQTSQSINVTNSGNYSVMVTDTNGCINSDNININLQAALDVDAGPNHIINLGDSIAINTTTTVTGNVTYSWFPTEGLSCTNCSDPVANPGASISYIVTITDTNGCVGRDTISIVVGEVESDPCEIFIPSAFSPNSDGNNDLFYIRGVCTKDLELKIYNRWGQKIFESNDVNIGWNGTYKGKQLDPAVFVYHCKIILTNGREILKSGNVSLIR